MSGGVAICFGLFLVGVAFGLAQLWFQLWSSDLFVKLILTDAAAFIVVAIWSFLVRERSDYQATRDGGKLS